MFDFDDAEAERFVVHEVADYEAEVALFGAGRHLKAAFGCVGEAVDFWEGHFERWVDDGVSSFGFGTWPLFGLVVVNALVDVCSTSTR